MDNEIVKTELSSTGILHVRLNSPQQLNALSHAVLTRLSAIFDDAKNNDATKTILLTGEGKAFCAGANINELAALNGKQGVQFAQFGQAVFRQLELLGKPSIAAINGFAFGGGLELAMSATMRIAADHALLGQPEIKLGVIPGFGGTQRLSRLIGLSRALELCLTGKRITAQEALQFGLVNEVTTAQNLLQQTEARLMELMQLPAFALQSVMSVIHQGYNLSLQDALHLEALQFGLCCDTADKKEGVSAFLEKRAAKFSGA